MVIAMASDDHPETNSTSQGTLEGPGGPGSPTNNENDAADSLGMSPACFDFDIRLIAPTARMTAEPGVDGGPAPAAPPGTSTADQFNVLASMDFGYGSVAGCLYDDMDVLMRTDETVWPNNIFFPAPDSTLIPLSNNFSQFPSSCRSFTSSVMGQMNITTA